MIGSRSKQSESVSSDGVSGTGTVGDARGPGGSAVAAGRAAPAVVNHHRLAPVPRTAAAAGAVGHRAGRVTRRAGARRTGLGLEGSAMWSIQAGSSLFRVVLGCAKV